MSSLLVAGGVYSVLPDGDLEYSGRRPDGGWHGHGYCCRLLWMLADGKLQRRRIWKHRWRVPGTTVTCHSRPPEDVASVWSCALIVSVMLWAWLDSGEGLHGHKQVLDELEGHGSPRTLIRWLDRAAAHALDVQQRIRSAVIERCEPRPIEQLFPSGLAPPEHLLRRRWRYPESVVQLWRALAMLFSSAVQLSVPAALLLAEARGKENTLRSPFPL